MVFHQLLHGYGKGHELLAGSITLPPTDSDLVVRLSDLSGSLPTESDFTPYLTTYPLPSGRYYAVARTWLDRNAPRSGCVLTHTILVPIEAWRSMTTRLGSITCLLREPSRSVSNSFTKPITIDSLESPRDTSELLIPEASQLAFVSKYFSDGLRPIVWFDAPEPEAILHRLIDKIWPKLKERFAACTFSLQPRALATTSFDLLFAPSSVYSRYSRIPRENFLEASRLPTRSQGPIEPWCERYASWLFSTKSYEPDSNVSDVSDALGPDPTSIRWLFMVNDLTARSLQSPMAALGAMDVVESFSAKPEANLEMKRLLVERAINAADKLDSDKALEHLHLISERLAHPAFSLVDDAMLERIRDRVAESALPEIERGLTAYERVLSSAESSSRGLNAFRSGLVSALLKIGSTHPERLAALELHPDAASQIIRDCPDIAGLYLRHGKSGREANDILRWVSKSEKSDDWVALTNSLIVNNAGTTSGHLFDELFSKLSSDQMIAVLEPLRDGRKYRSQPILSIIEGTAAPYAPDAVRRWALSLNDWTPAISKVVAATFQNDQSGLEEILQSSELDSDSVASVLADFVLRVADRGVPRWLQNAAENDPRLLGRLLGGDLRSDRVALAVMRLVRQGIVLPFPVLELGRSALLRNPNSSAHELQEAIFSSSIRWILRGGVPIDFLQQQYTTNELETLYSIFDAPRLMSIVTDEVRRSSEAWEGAWVWVLRLPDVMYRSDVSFELVGVLLRQAYVHWRHEIADTWVSILERAHSESLMRVRVKHGVQALQYSYRYTSLPLGRVVRTAFPRVYSVALDDAECVNELGPLLSYSDWDRARSLRGSLVESFLRSDWPPGELALAAHESFGLGKMFKRVWRRWGGERYIERMVRDLEKRDNRNARELAEQLREMIRNPDFHEPWV